jgi:hypothetical protein
MSLDDKRRIAEQQLAFRAQNERIYASADAVPVLGPIPFVCECADPTCTEIVRLSDAEYDTITQHPRRFFNISGHETPSVEAGAEELVTVVGDLTVVVKIGAAGELAAESRHPARG